jgi:phenol/toluene 2-monooxygenase (NADH) P1/A1
VLFDKKRTKIVMKDWYALKDPRQYYYGAYTIARARQQDAAESSFEMIEDRGLAEMIPAELKQTALDVLVPMRHVEWGGNMGNSYISAYGYGTVITQPCLYHAMDHLGVAQYLTRIGLVLDGPEALDAAKEAWMSGALAADAPHVENLLVLQDWFEIFVAQNLVLEGLLNPMLYDYLDAEFSANGGTAISMMTRFMGEWSAETAKWVDAQIKVAAAESAENKAQLSAWVTQYRAATLKAWRRSPSALSATRPTICWPNSRPNSMPAAPSSAWQSRSIHVYRIYRLSNQRGHPADHRVDPRRQPACRARRAAGHGQDQCRGQPGHQARIDRGAHRP